MSGSSAMLHLKCSQNAMEATDAAILAVRKALKLHEYNLAEQMRQVAVASFESFLDETIAAHRECEDGRN